MSVILQKAAEKDLPGELIGSILKSNTSTFGLALAQGGIIERHAIPAGIDQQTFDELIAGWGKSSLTLQFGDYTTTPDEEALQPFVVLTANKSEAPLLVAFLEGDFVPYHRDNGHHPAYNCAQEFLIPELTELYTECGQDMAAMFKELDTPKWKNRFKNTAAAKGVIVLLAASGVSKIFTKHDADVKTFDFGFTTDAYGYSDTATAVADEPKKTGIAALLLKKKQQSAATAVPSVPPKKDAVSEQMAKANATSPLVEDVHEQAVVAQADDDKPKKEFAKRDGYKVALIKPPINIIRAGKNAKKKWYRETRIDPYTGKLIGETLPNGWDKSGGCEIWAWQKLTLADAKVSQTDVHKLAHEELKKDTAPHNKPSADVKPVKHTETEKPLEVPAEEVAAPFSPVPVVPAEVITEISTSIKEGLLKKIIDASANAVPDPSRAAEFEKKHPSFMELFGSIHPSLKTTEDLYRMPWEFFAQINTEALRVLAFNLRNRCMMQDQKIQALAPKNTTSTTAPSRKFGGVK